MVIRYQLSVPLLREGPFRAGDVIMDYWIVGLFTVPMTVNRNIRHSELTMMSFRFRCLKA